MKDKHERKLQVHLKMRLGRIIFCSFVDRLYDASIIIFTPIVHNHLVIDPFKSTNVNVYNSNITLCTCFCIPRDALVCTTVGYNSVRILYLSIKIEQMQHLCITCESRSRSTA